MRKILLAISNQQINENAIDFACYIAKLTQSRLTGVFLNEENLQPFSTAAAISYNEPAGSVLLRPSHDQLMAEQKMQFFTEICEREGIRPVVYQQDERHNKVTAIENIIMESRYADLLIVDPETPFYYHVDCLPNHFVKEVVANVECPLVISPNNFEGVDEIAFCCDGSLSSIFAMKQFIYLFPQYTDKKAMVLDISGEGKTMINKDKIRSWISCYYSKIGFHVLEGNVREQLHNYFLGRKNLFVVMGAYGRSMLSNFFTVSINDHIVRVVDLPLFIAHN